MTELTSFSGQKAEGRKEIFIRLSRLLPLAEGEGLGSVQVSVVAAECRSVNQSS